MHDLNLKRYKKFEQLFETLGAEISLSSSEKARMEGVVREYISFKPARISKPLHRRFMKELMIAAFIFRRRLAPAALIIALFTGAGVSYAAEGALPGDALYPIKVSVNEEVRGAFAVSPETRAKWQTRRVERRLEEAIALAASGRITSEAGAMLARNLDVQATEAAYTISELEQKEPDQALAAGSDFDATLTAHGDILDELGNVVEGIRAEVRSLASLARGKILVSVVASPESPKPVEDRRLENDDGADVSGEAGISLLQVEVPSSASATAETASLRASVSSSGSTLTVRSVDRLAASAEESIRTARGLLTKAERSNLRGGLGVEGISRFRIELAAIEEEYEAGVRLAEAHDLDGAHLSLRRAIDQIHRLLVAIKTSASLHIDISVHEGEKSGGRNGDATPATRPSSDGGEETMILPAPFSGGGTEATVDTGSGEAKAEAKTLVGSQGEADISGGGSDSAGSIGSTSNIKIDFRIR